MTTQVTGSGVNFNGSTSGTILLTQPAIAGTNTITLPAETGTLRSTVSVGTVLQQKSTKLGTVATGTTLMVNDNTIPQNTEGDQFITLAFTPQSAASTLRFQALMFVAHTVATANVVAAIFRDSVADAIAAGNVSCPNANTGYMVAVNYDMTSPGTSAYTYKLRAGGNAAGTLTVNGWSSTQYFGGVLFSSLTITEYVP